MKLLSNCNCNSTDILSNAIIESVIVIELFVIEPRSGVYVCVYVPGWEIRVGVMVSIGAHHNPLII